MSDSLHDTILNHLKSGQYRPQKLNALARELGFNDGAAYGAFKDAVRDLMNAGRVVLGMQECIILPTERTSREEFTGTYRHNKRGFGFVVPLDPSSHEDLFIPPGDNCGAISGDVVRAKITNRHNRDGKQVTSGRITEVVERKNKRFVGSLQKVAGEWVVMPDGNNLTEPILAPDAGSKHIRVGTQVVVELTIYPENGQRAQGVITEVLGQAGEKDVDLKSVIVQFNLPGEFPDTVRVQARQAVDDFQPDEEHLRAEDRFDLSDRVVCTIDPDDAKDYDDAISLRKTEDGYWELGVHIADVSHFVPEGSPLDVEARERGNSSYFPGHVIPMLPEILSNGVCSLQEGVPRFCKSAFITYDSKMHPIRSKYASTVIRSRRRLRYTEAQDLIDGKSDIRHTGGTKKRSEYPAEVLDLLKNMNDLALKIQARRHAAGQLVLNLPEVDLVLDEDGKVIDAVKEDTSFTHTLIEMFMVEANEAVARLLDSLNLPFLRRIHPEPDLDDTTRLKTFTLAAGHKLPKQMDRKALQALLESVKGKPEAFAINLAVLKTLTRAEYSPLKQGHFALASEHYGHFTSPIRRYADLTIHRLLERYLAARHEGSEPSKGRKAKVELGDVPSEGELKELGKHLSFTERRSEDAERELRRVKVLELMVDKVGQEFDGVITGITNFGMFIQLQKYLNDGLIRYDELGDDYWQVDEKAGFVKGRRTGKKFSIGDVVRTTVVKVNVQRRELDLAVSELISKAGSRPSRDQRKPQGGQGGQDRPRAKTPKGRTGGRSQTRSAPKSSSPKGPVQKKGRR